MRLALLLGSLVLALLLAVVTLQTPAPVAAGAPASAFSAVRAMTDVRVIARAPHPVGSSEHEQVRGYLFGRMAALGLSPQVQTGAMSPGAIRRQEGWGLPAVATQAHNLVGVLPGRDPSAPAVLLMAHYDSVPGSPAAADDAAGVAAILESVRALRARGQAERSLVVVFTDGEELNLDGARVFFSEHPLRDRIGVVLNLEARGGGGQAMMFETGRGNAETIALYQQAARHFTGGPSSNALAVVVYEHMPNGTDFTIPKDRGLPGLNFAFIGRPSQYHSPTSTPDVLDQGSLQHIGSQALESADVMLRTPRLPKATRNVVYADLMGWTIVGHAQETGWILLAVALGLTLFAAWGARHATRMGWIDVARGVGTGVWLVAMGLVLAPAVRALAGPIASRIQSAETYYTLLRRLPWIEAGVGLAMLAVVLASIAGRRRIGRRALAVLALVAVVAVNVMGGLDVVVIGAGVVAVVLSLWPRTDGESPWGDWLGLILLVLLLGAALQAIAPEAAFLLIWPALVASFLAALSALIGARLERMSSFIPAALGAILVGGWLLGQAHGVFLGIGMDFPGAVAVFALLMAVFVRPLAPPGAVGRGLAAAAAACLILGCAVSVTGQFAEPAPPPVTGPAPL